MCVFLFIFYVSPGQCLPLCVCTFKMDYVYATCSHVPHGQCSELYVVRVYRSALSSGPVAGVLSSAVTPRVTIMLGSLLIAFGLLTASFASDLVSLILFYGVVAGEWNQSSRDPVSLFSAEYCGWQLNPCIECGMRMDVRVT